MPLFDPRLQDQFENRFAQQQQPFGEAGGEGTGLNFLDAFQGVSRNEGGGFNFGEFNQTQRRIARGIAFDQFLNPALSGQQQEAVQAVQRNRVARGLRGRAAEAAGTQAAERFAAGNRRAALSFIESDVGSGDVLGRLREGGLLGENQGITDFLARAQAFRLLSSQRTDFSGVGGGELSDISRFLGGTDRGRAAGQVRAGFFTDLRTQLGGENRLTPNTGGAAPDRQGIVQSLGIEGPTNPLLNDFLGFAALQATARNRHEFAAQHPELDLSETGSRIAANTGEFLDQFAENLGAAFSPDRAIGGQDSFDAFSQAFGLDPDEFRNTFRDVRGLPGQQLMGSQFRQRRGGQTTGSFQETFGAVPGLGTIGDLQERINAAEQVATTGDLRNSQSFLTVGGNLAATNQRVTGGQATALARNELDFLRGQQTQLEQLRSTLFSPFRF